jgi:two-component system response regulator CpxR
MLTARGEDVDRIVGLEMGADDYMPKPFNPRELVARIRAIGRRDSRMPSAANSSRKPRKLVVGDIALDTGTRLVTQNGSPVSMTAVEFNLLRELLEQAGTVVHRDALARSVLGRDLESFDRSIDVHVSNLRKKLGHQRDGIERIRTVRGVGYLYTCMESS